MQPPPLASTSLITRKAFRFQPCRPSCPLGTTMGSHFQTEEVQPEDLIDLGSGPLVFFEKVPAAKAPAPKCLLSLCKTRGHRPLIRPNAITRRREPTPSSAHYSAAVRRRRRRNHCRSTADVRAFGHACFHTAHSVFAKQPVTLQDRPGQEFRGPQKAPPVPAKLKGQL